jgi:hypothetical protein
MAFPFHRLLRALPATSLARHSSLPAQPAIPHVPSPPGRALPLHLLPIAVGPPRLIGRALGCHQLPQRSSLSSRLSSDSLRPNFRSSDAN